jgi:hypothetical protein
MNEMLPVDRPSETARLNYLMSQDFAREDNTEKQREYLIRTRHYAEVALEQMPSGLDLAITKAMLKRAQEELT